MMGKKYKDDRNNKEIENITLIDDQYTRHRGSINESNLLTIFCTNCQEYLMTYQKDGPGRLLRCYLDRIHDSTFKNLDEKKLECSTCNTVVGYSIVYEKIYYINKIEEKEKRTAYKMLEGKFFFQNTATEKKIRERYADESTDKDRAYKKPKPSL